MNDTGPIGDMITLDAKPMDEGGAIILIWGDKLKEPIQIQLPRNLAQQFINKIQKAMAEDDGA